METEFFTKEDEIISDSIFFSPSEEDEEDPVADMDNEEFRIIIENSKHYD